MSVVVAIKYKDGVAIAADKQVTSGTNKNDNAMKLHSFKYSNSAIGTVGYLRDCNVVRTIEEIIPYKDILDNIKIDELYVIQKIIPVLLNHMEQNNRIITTNGLKEMDSHMLYATPNAIFKIGGDFSVIEEQSYATIGCGSDKVVGFIASVGDTSNYNRSEIIDVLVCAIAKACEKDVYINDNIDFIFLKKEDINVSNKNIYR